MRRVERHQGCKSVTPLGNGIQCLGVGSLIGIVHVQLRTNGAGIGERQADLETEPRSCLIERNDLQGVVFFGGDGASAVLLCRFLLIRTGTGPVVSRRGVVVRGLTFDAVGGQLWQPQAEDTPPVSRKGTPYISIP